ncbi:hypothetical protein BC829DRAFT_34631 [Chytridium lagenaria]|nr:hypothetical protein BC829DRAFT_34631 [Chytridium lagenaria]
MISYVHIWDLRMEANAGELKPRTSFCSWTGGATAVKWNRKSRWLLASSHDTGLKIWDVRKGSTPLTSITAHMTKVYGIDWNPLDEKEIVTCSQDQTVKFWDIDDPRNCKGTIFTPAPVWRARFTPFGNGILTMPQRKDCDLTMWSCRNLSDPVHAFKGHTDVVREFVWRVKEQPEPLYQLITWSKDQTLRLWPMSSDVLGAVGHQQAPSDPLRNLPIGLLGDGLAISNAGSVYSSPKGAEASYLNESGYAQLWSNSESVLTDNVTISMDRTVTVSKGASIPSTNRTIKDKKVDTSGKADLTAELSFIRKKFPAVTIERVDDDRRIITIGFQRAFDVSGASPNDPLSNRSAYIRVNIFFPLNSGKGDNATFPMFEIAKTGMLSMAQRTYLSSKLSSLSNLFSLRGESPLEPCLRFLLFGESVASSEEPLATYSARRSSSVHAGMFSLANADVAQNLSGHLGQGKNTTPGGPGADVLSKSLDESVSSNDEEAQHAGTRIKLKGEPNMMSGISPEASNIPFPRLCGASFSFSGKLVCFFSQMPHPNAVRYTAYSLSSRNHQPVLQPQMFPYQPKTYTLYESYRNFLVERFPQLVKFKVVPTANDKESKPISSSNDVQTGEIHKVLNQFGNNVDYWFDDDDDEESFSNNQMLGNLMIGSYASPGYNPDLQTRLQSALKAATKKNGVSKSNQPSGFEYLRGSNATGSVPLSPALSQKHHRERVASVTGETSTSTPFASAVTSLGQSATSVVSAESWATPPASIASRRGTIFGTNTDAINTSMAVRGSGQHRRSRSFHEVSRPNLADLSLDNDQENSIDGTSSTFFGAGWKAERESSRTSLTGSLSSDADKDSKLSEGISAIHELDEAKDSYGIKVAIYDVSPLLPVSARLARLYRIDGDSPMEICAYNSDVAMDEGRPDLAKIWAVAALILAEQKVQTNVGKKKPSITRKSAVFKIQNFDDVNTLRVEDQMTDKKSLDLSFQPLGRDLVNSLFTNLELCGDFQTMALLCCVFFQKLTAKH